MSKMKRLDRRKFIEQHASEDGEIKRRLQRPIASARSFEVGDVHSFERISSILHAKRRVLCHNIGIGQCRKDGM